MTAQQAVVLPAAKDVNLYEVLGLPTPGPSTASSTTDEVKAAYRRALLKYHPDKLSRTEALEASSKCQVNESVSGPQFTIDDVRRSHEILTTPALRREYDQDLQLFLSGSQTAKQALNQRTTELEVLDIDELLYDDVDNVYHKACRCGNPRGFAVSDDDLLDSGDSSASLGEVLLECPDCSHHVRVTYTLVDDGK